MPTMVEIKADYLAQHAALEDQYYSQGAITKEQFDTQHAQLWDNYSAEIETASDYPMPSPEPIQYWGEVIGFQVGEQPIRVQRTWRGRIYEFDCYVSLDLKDAYDSGDLVIGDIVIVFFVDNDRDKPFASQKVYKSW